ncbi:Cytochrome c oxidase assembly factor 6 [Pseudozyma hubeiensis]|nr:Cytochrome c oxidase assembly factor 6 [Pseudozyma hubeiensis]
MSATPEPAPAPTRNERKACWSHRDSYFECLTRKGVTIPPGTDMSDGRGPVGKAAKEEQERLEREKKQTVDEARKQDPCLAERQGYETNCARSWVDYFNKRRVLEERQRMMYEQSASQGPKS